MTAPRGITPTQKPEDAANLPSLTGLVRRREVFWHNVVREILNALSAAAQSAGRVKGTAGGAAMGPRPTDEMFDGRMAVITKLGQRIPIADVFPVFACSVSWSESDRMLSNDVQCTVFQIRTPGGEVYTLPVHEIAAFHALSEELLKKIEQAAQNLEDGQQLHGMPFGFAAYTSLARSEGLNEEIATQQQDEDSDEGAKTPESPG